jgi:hypothetical protein
MVYFIIFVFYRNFYIDATLHQVIREMGRIDTLEQFTHKPLTRRNFLTQTLRSGFGLAVGMTSLGLPLACTGRKITVSEKKQDIFQPYRNKKQKKLPITSIPLIKEAMYYKKLIHGRGGSVETEKIMMVHYTPSCTASPLPFS